MPDISSEIPTTTPPPAPRKRRFYRHRWFLVVSVISLAILAFGGWWLVFRTENLNDVNVIKAKISKHYLLPTDETPALATVTDSTKVQSNFSAKVKNDDKVLIYENNKKAIVYRPSIDRIVDVEPVTINDPSGTSIPNKNPFED